MTGRHGSGEDEDELGTVGVEDMIQLMDLSEQTLLRNLQLRYNNGTIYTYTGSILVSVNPYKMFNIYGLDMVKKYEGQVIGTLPPHLFAIGSAAYDKMVLDTENQVVVISGESGAGKTEATKLTMQYLAAVNKSTNNLITEQILEASPLLESFGNSKTIRNDNSSRFGKYVEMYFKSGSIVGAKTSDFLLEKSRIVTQAPDERNYHIFYEMLQGLGDQQMKKYGLQAAEKYFYLNQGGSCQLVSRDDSQNFRDVQAAMEVLGMSTKEQDSIYKILASVLHLGNIYFKKKSNDQEGVVMGSEAEIKWVSHLLQLSEDWLKQGLTNKVTEARQERLLTPLMIDQALDARDAIAKALYSRLFTWLVERINHIVQGGEKDHRTTSIAILDIFGFEDFKDNSFEQLCINYANESLQFYFNKNIFKLEQAEYARENIDWTAVEFQDNQPTIDLISKKPLGILHVLDDESSFPKASDLSFLEKCHFNHVSSQLYRKPQFSAPEFSIVHYAGTVTYRVKNFLDKNRDTLRSDVMELLIQSKNEIISQMFSELRESTLNRTVSKLTGLYVTTRPKTLTVAASFHESLIALMETMSKCNPWFVRCLKPNNQKAPLLFEMKVLLSQLRYTGMLETIRIRKMGYPVRLRFSVFVERYHVLLRKAPKSKSRPNPTLSSRDSKDVCRDILQGLGSIWLNTWQLGNTKVFLRESLSFHLNDQKSKVLSDSVLLLQRALRGFLARRHFHACLRATQVLQQVTKAWVARVRYQRMREGFIKAQAQYRMVRQKKQYAKMREEAHRQRLAAERLAEDTRRRQAEEAELHRRQQEENRRIEAEQAQWRRLEEARLRKEAAERERQVKPQQLSQRRLDRFDKYQSVRKLSWIEEIELQERQARTVVSVASLEIPTDLAYILGKVDDWQPVHNDRHLMNVVGNVVPRDMNFVLPSDIDSYVFSKFVHVYFKEPWEMRKSPITQPFLAKTSESEARLAVAMFSLILRFMNDPHLSGLREKIIADYVVQMGLSHNSLRDEIYAQICNQTWLNRNAANNERGWYLMSHCLSAFPPSRALAKYLVKYVSDHAYDGYRVYCQHKLLQCADMEAPLCRYYPPCLLEWRALRKKAGMALEAKFADNELGIGHVESWTTAEEFSAHLLKCRQITEGHYGWTVCLHDGNDTYEANGYDYVLDLMSEMEIPPAFPWTQAPFLVTCDMSNDTSMSRRAAYEDSPHHADTIPRPVPLQVEELLQPVPVSPRPAPQPETFYQHSSSPSLESPYSTREQLSASDPTLSKTSILNVRYMKRPAPGPPSPDGVRSSSPPPLVNGTAMQPLNVTIPDDTAALATSKLNQRYTKNEPALAASKLNQRYAGQNGAVPNGNLPNGNVVRNGGKDISLSDSRLNKRYSKHNAPTQDTRFDNRASAKNEVLRRQRSTSSEWDERASQGSHHGSHGPMDMDQWLDMVFTPILDTGVDDLNDAQSLHRRLKGGGEGVPGVGQPSSGPHTSYVATGLNAPPGSSITYVSPPQGAAAGSIQVANNPNQLAAQQALLLTQQAQIEAQTSQLQSQLQQQSLQNQLLQQSVQGEILRQQLRHLQAVNNPPVPAAPAYMSDGRPVSGRVNVVSNPNSPPAQLLTNTSPNSGQQFMVAMATSPPRSPNAPRRAKPPVPTPLQQQHFPKPPAHGEIDKKHPGGVKTLTRSFETKMPSPDPPVNQNQPRSPPLTVHNSSSALSPIPNDPKVTFSESITTINRTEQQNVSPGGSPGSQRRSSLPSGGIPPPPPPPPPPPQEFETFEEPSGAVATADTLPPKVKKDGAHVRVGKIQWPPPQKQEKKPEPEVGKLLIDEKRIEGSVRPLRTQEDVHMRTMELIRSTSKEPAESRPQRHPVATHTTNKDVVSHRSASPPPQNIDMASRRQALQKKLSQAGILGSAESGSPTSPTSPTRERTPVSPGPPPAPPSQWAPPPPPPPAPVPYSPDRSRKWVPEPSIPDSPDGNVSPAEVPVDLKALEHVRTQLFTQGYNPFFQYHRVPWQIHIRKEVFTPEEKPDKPAVVTLLFCQIVQDVFSPSCVRIQKEDRMRMRSLLESHGVTPRTVLNNHKAQVKKLVIDTAREWPYYFARLFPVNGGRSHPTTQVLAVTHTGIKLLSWERDLVQNSLNVEEAFTFEQVVDVSVPKLTALQIHASSKYIILYTPKASLIQRLIESFCIEAETSSIYVRATRNYVTREKTLLSFQEGDVIKLTNKDSAVNKGWLVGALHGRTGLFPSGYIKPVSKHAKEPTSESEYNVEGDNLYHTLPAGGKYSMLEFAMLHFRESPFRGQKTTEGISDWTWKEQADLVKWTKSPIQASLLKFESPEMNKLALECFLSIMKFMGDYPLSKSQKTADCVYFILKACYNHPEIRDEVYCQLVKQTTNNRSPIGDSQVMGWRFMTIVTAYFDCTDILKPYLQNYLEQTGYDNQRAQQSLAAQSLQNLRMTFKYGGRKNVPSRVEVEALTRGRNTKRQPCLLPIGQPVILSVRSCTVVAEAIDYICSKLDISDGLEREEFTIFYVIESENRYYPLNREEYIFDVTTELANQKKEFHLLFQRTSWVFRLRLETGGLYNDMMYKQCLPDFLDGFMLPRPGPGLPEYIKDELGMLAALQLRAEDYKGVLQQKDVLAHIPRNAQQVQDMTTQRWVNLVQAKQTDIMHLDASQARSTFLDILSKWPLFGSTFFKIKGVADPRVDGECHMAINKEGVHFLKAKTHETLISYPMSEMISTRRFRSEKGVNYLDIKCGNLMVQKVTRVETDYGKDISTLIAQYINILNKMKPTSP